MIPCRQHVPEPNGAIGHNPFVCRRCGVSLPDGGDQAAQGDAADSERLTPESSPTPDMSREEQ